MTFAKVEAVLLVAVLSVAIGGCQQNEQIDSGVDVLDGTCVDRDHDSYGVNCEAGLDCDDNDSSIWADCNPDQPCNVPRAGCECAEEGEEIECRTSEPIQSPDGATLCYAGVRTCVDGLWSTCDSLYSYDPTDSESTSMGDPEAMNQAGVRREAVLGYPTACTASCDSGCHHIYDCPAGTDFTAENSTNLRYDIIESDAATIIDNDFVQGTFYRTFGMTCPVDMMSSWWALDFDFEFLDVAGDQRIDIDVRPALSEDDLISLFDESGWIPVVRCPDSRTDVTPACTHPSNPHDRAYGGGNLYDALGDVQARYQWLQMRVRLYRNDALDSSPRFRHTDVFFFCGDAS